MNRGEVGYQLKLKKMETTNKRLLSIDILRGFTIIFMIIVNDPGSWSHVYSPLLHAKWNGITPTDYIFPTFLFIVGVSIVLSLSEKVENKVSKKTILKKIFWRSLKIYLVGLFLWLWPNFDFENIRWVETVAKKVRSSHLIEWKTHHVLMLCCMLVMLETIC